MLRRVTQALEIAWSLRDERYRAHWMMRQVIGVPARKKIAAGRVGKLPKPDWRPSAEAIEKAGLLARDGFVLARGAVPAEWVAEMRDYFSRRPCSDPYRKLPSFTGPENAPPGTHVAFFENDVVAKAPHALEVANLPLLVETVAEEMGAKPTISYMTAWWSVPARDGIAQHTERYHRDADDFDFTKFFIYLTDIDDDAGPHVFMKGSHAVDKLTSIRRYSDEEVFAAVERENEMRFTGPAGSCFLEKTYGMHRGLPPVGKPRLLFQVLYSLRSTIYGPKQPIFDSPPPGVKVDAYMNRVYCRAT